MRAGRSRAGAQLFALALLAAGSGLSGRGLADPDLGGPGGGASPGSRAGADLLSIRDLQFSTAASGWRSAHEGEVVSFGGGVVTHVVGFRITLQDPTLGAEWAGIEVRAFEDEAPLAAVRVGDRVDFFDVLVEEFRGGTIPQFKSDSSFEIVSRGHPLPEPVTVPLAELAHPPDRERCERFEGMLVAVEDVRVGEMDWGKAEDNYELSDGEQRMWASDYSNLDLAVPPFPTYYVQRGERYARIAGIYQEYTYPEEGWEYYQLLPRGTGDYVRSSLYTIRDVQESSAADGWASLLEGRRIDLAAVVSAERRVSGGLALLDRWLGGEWAGVLLLDPQRRLPALSVGDEIRLASVLVSEAAGLTSLAYDNVSSVEQLASGERVEGTLVDPAELARGAGPAGGERYEGMLVSLYNGRVARRGLPEGDDLYSIAFGSDTLLACDRESAVLPPDSTFFVRAGDRLGRLRGIVTQREAPGGPCYVVEPRDASDYEFVGDDATHTTWGRLKHAFR